MLFLLVVNFVIFSLRATILINLNLNLSRRQREMYSGHGRLCVCVCVSVCLSAAAFPQYCADPDVTWGMIGMVWGALRLCTIGRICNRVARVAFLRQHGAEREMTASVCTRSMTDSSITRY